LDARRPRDERSLDPVVEVFLLQSVDFAIQPPLRLAAGVVVVRSPLLDRCPIALLAIVAAKAQPATIRARALIFVRRIGQCFLVSLVEPTLEAQPLHLHSRAPRL
jgi:hypothetical protein